MKDITYFIKQDLYPAIFDSLDTVLPEFEFERFANGWRSSFKLDLSAPKIARKDKTVVTKKIISHLLEQGGDSIDLISYVMQRHGLEFPDAVKFLAAKVGMQLPDSSNYNSDVYRENARKEALLLHASEYFSYLLKSETCTDKNKQALLNYLNERGYIEDDVYKNMGLGYVPNQKQIKDYFLSLGYQVQETEAALNLQDSRIGRSHILAIPFTSGSTIKGFKYRSIDKKHTPKYLNTKGLDIKNGLYNLSPVKGDKDIVVVEGELDSLNATARGINNVVALAGNSLSKEQVQNAIQYGAQSFTLCLDYEANKEEITKSKVQTAISTLLDEGIDRIYVAQLPKEYLKDGSNKLDPDSLIKNHGIEAFQDTLDKAVYYWKYWLDDKIGEYESKTLSSKDIDRFVGESISLGNQIQNPIHRDLFVREYTANPTFQSLGITKESFDLIEQWSREEQSKEKHRQTLRKGIEQLHNLVKNGKFDSAESSIKDLSRLNYINNSAQFDKDFAPKTEAYLREKAYNKLENLKIDYFFDAGREIPLEIPSGALSFFVAPTSHGKTTMLTNLALKTALQEKEVYFYSYEEDDYNILNHFLNAYINLELNKNNTHIIDTYLRSGKLDLRYISTEVAKSEVRTQRLKSASSKTDDKNILKECFLQRKDAFFKDLIETKLLNISYVNYDIELLINSIRHIKATRNPQAVFIDYMQLLNLPSEEKRYRSRQEELKEVCIRLKDLAIETQLPIILSAQFNREVTDLTKIHYTSIGEAGDIERIANLIIGMWNNNFEPLKVTESDKKIIEKWNKLDTIYLKILKNRAGRAGQETLLNYSGNKRLIWQKNDQYNPKEQPYNNTISNVEESEF